MAMKSVDCIVPARLGSSRFPGKPLVRLCGREMILRTLDRAKAANCFSQIICATDSEQIAELVRRAGYEAELTGEAFTGSDRVAEVAIRRNCELVVNLQGDEPMAELDLLKRVASTLKEHPESWVTASSPLNPEDALNPTVVKVRLKQEMALDFSRSVSDIKQASETQSEWEEHRGIYAYSLDALREFKALPPSSREIQESLEQMRVLGHRPIRVVRTNRRSASIDTESDVIIMEQLIQQEEREFCENKNAV